MREDLPAAAARHREWPVRLDHCFARVILDEVCGGPWRLRLAAPAWRHLSPTALEAAISLADAILDGRADLDALNRRSLQARRRTRLSGPTRPVSPTDGEAAPPQPAARGQAAQ